jgi:SpoVK/Ycf46/Vps4 family AAA+-type ATPase
MTDPLTPLLRSLLSAVAASPEDVPLRLHVAELLLDAGQGPAALEHCATALRLDPGDERAIRLLGAITSRLAGAGGAPSSEATLTALVRLPEDPHPQAGGDDGDFDWREAERLLGEDAPAGAAPRGQQDTNRPALRLADVGGMEKVKERLEAAFLIPMANPSLREMYAKSLSGGMLLYGPPGCGKTFIARALAGELGASFRDVSLADVLDSFLGASERNVRDIFDLARARRPAVLFFDEVDAVGQKRANLRANPAMRGTVNQLLTEMDSVSGTNDGVYVLAATNHPWDVDSALRRPGRFDRTVFVGPPDATARHHILGYHLGDRPVEDINYDQLVKRTEGYSGADLAHVCETATEAALLDSARSGVARPINTVDLCQALEAVHASTAEWFVTAKSAATFANHNGLYDDLLAYLGGKGRR